MNKYKIYVNSKSLYDYIVKNKIEDKGLFIEKDFRYVFNTGSEVNFFSPLSELIDGIDYAGIYTEIGSDATEVTPEDFLIAIGYLPEEEKVKIIPPIKAEDIHYICESMEDDILSAEVNELGYTFITLTEASSRKVSIKLSPEGLIELGSDLVRLGVSLRDWTYQE